MSEVFGIINYYKEKDISSFQAVSYVRKLYGVKKAGHIGTLDPLAEGILPICLGHATKFVQYLMSREKTYISEMQLGIKTDSFDTTGSTLASNDDIIPTKDRLVEVLDGMCGKQTLTVPSFSAKKIDGVRAYKLARKGLIEDAGVAEMDIDSIKLLDYSYPFSTIEVVCGKGTYIRSIIDTVGDTLGSYAVMSQLIRARNGYFDISNSSNRDQLEMLSKEDRLSESIIDIRDALSNWKRVTITDEFLPRLMNGAIPCTADFVKVDTIDLTEDNIFIENSYGDIVATATIQNNRLKLINVFN